MKVVEGSFGKSKEETQELKASEFFEKMAASCREVEALGVDYKPEIVAVVMQPMGLEIASNQNVDTVNLLLDIAKHTIIDNMFGMGEEEYH